MEFSKIKGKITKKHLLIIGLALLLLIIIYSVFFVPAPLASNSNSVGSSKSGGQTQKVIVTEDTFASYLSLNQIVQELPSGASISLKTSNKEYAVTKGSVKEGKADNPDMTLTIPSFYVPKMGDGFCKTVNEAINNRDLTVNYHKSTASMAWKYKSLYKYKSCIGL